MALFATKEESIFNGATARRDFPIFTQKMNDKPLVFLDTAASAQKPKVVIDALQNALNDNYANIHRGLYQFSQKTTTQFENARGKVARFINALENEIVFTRNGTEAINLVAACWGRTRLNPGDEILITALEHHANIVPWQLIAQRTGAKLIVAPITNEGDVKAADVIALMNEKTQIVAISHMSNALGTMLPVTEIIQAAKKINAATLLDGCQAIMHESVDVMALGCDFYVFSGHKLYGPTGVGVLYGREQLLNAMPPYQGGGDMIETVSFDETTYKMAPARFEAGTPAIAEVIALGAAIDYLNAYGMNNIAAYEEGVYHYALEELNKIDGLTLYGRAENKAAILCFNLRGAHPSDVATILDKEGIAVRAGHHCCMPLMKRLGVTGTLRASIGLYNTRDDIDALVAGLGKAGKMLA